MYAREIENMTSDEFESSELTAPMHEPENPEEQDRLAAEILDRLAKAGFLPEGDLTFPAEDFRLLADRVHAAFSVPHTTMTPLARRVLYGISAAQQPRVMVVLGTFVGYAAVWLFGPALPPNARFDAGRMIGCDIFEPALTQAKDNFEELCPGDSPVELLLEDAHEFLDRMSEPIDLLYLDVDSQERGKRDYHDLLRRSEERLNKNALVLAHDVTHPFYVEDVADYQQAVKDKSRFRRTATLHIDPCGLEVTMAL